MKPVLIPPQCRFCYPLSSENQSLVLDQTDNFYVMLSLGPLVEGYLLVCSKEHYSCLANLPPSLYLEFFKLKEKVNKILKITYGGCIFYEHGQSKSCIEKSPHEPHCYHTHLHAIPTTVDLFHVLAKDLKVQKISSIKKLREIFIKHNRYLYYEDNLGQVYAFIINKKIRRQYLRWVLGKKLGIPQKANWAKYPGLSKIKAARNKLMNKFKEL